MSVVAVIGAAGRTGRAVCRALVAAGHAVQAVVRETGQGAGLPGQVSVSAAADPAAQAALCAGVDSVVSCAPVTASTALIQALAAAGVRPHCVLLGSTRRYSRIPDPSIDPVLDLEAAFLGSGIPGVLLHPTMIYGAVGENNVRRIAAIARFGVIPLPDGGRSQIQPIHANDVAQAMAAAVTRRAVADEPVVIAGPEPLPYADFVRAVARAAGRRVRIVPVPLGLALALARLTALIPVLPLVRREEILRLTEDKAFDISPARQLLGFAPMPLAAGLALTFGDRDTDR